MTGCDSTPAPRWEFRIFGASLAAERAALAAVARPGDADPPRRDVYLAPPRGPEAMLKIRDADRDAAFDLKTCEARRGGLELWRPAGKAAPPLPAEELRRRFLDPAGLAAALPAGPVGADAVRAACAALGAAIVPVRKRRRRFRLGEVRAEVARIDAAGAPRVTLALECPDADALRAALDRLGLDPARNESYLALIRRIAFAAG